MDKIITKKTVIKTIEEEIESIIYQTNDGMIFDEENEALEHEEKLNFLSYFNDKYKLKMIESSDYGLNYNDYVFCHLIFIKKLCDETLNDLIKFYDLNDHPDDILKFESGWLFIIMLGDESSWIFDETKRIFIVEKLEDVIKNKKNELKLLEKLI